MNIKKIIKEEIGNLPSFGVNTCMLVHKSGDVFMSNHVTPNFYTTDDMQKSIENPQIMLSIDSFCYPCDQQEKRLKTFIRKVEAYEKYGHGHAYDNNGSVSLTRREPFQYNPREFEVVEYYKGLIPVNNNIFESDKDDFDWADNIEPGINSCEDLIIGEDYKITGNYCFEFHETPFTLVGIVDVDTDSSGTIVPHLVIDLHRYMIKNHYYETHKADGLCKKKTCFNISCNSLTGRDYSDKVEITI